MKKLLTILILISLLLFGQTNSPIIKNKNSGKESTVNKGEDVRVITKDGYICKGEFTKIFYDSSLNSTLLKIDNYTIPYDAVKSIS